MSEIFPVDLNGKKSLALRAIKSEVIAAMTGWSGRLAAGQYIRVTDPCGKQAADFWAFNAADLDEHLSAMHTRVWVNKLCPGPGESFHSNHRRPILRMRWQMLICMHFILGVAIANLFSFHSAR